MINDTLKILFLLIVAVPLASFNERKQQDPSHEDVGSVELVISLVTDGQPFHFNTAYNAPGGDIYSLKSLKFFISDIGFSLSTGIENSAQSGSTTQGVFFVDFKEPKIKTDTLRETVKFKVKTGDYSDIRFNIGIPRQLNHSDPTVAPPPLDIGKGDMYWEWNSGYIFFLAEGQGPQIKNNLLHFAIGEDSRIMPFAFGNLFDMVPLIKIKKGKTTRIEFQLDLNKILTNGDGKPYALNSFDAANVHGGYFADVLRMNILRAMKFKSSRIIE
jgi:hypothetical protein